MKHRINVSLALILSCVLAASSNLVFASNISLRTAVSPKTERLRFPKHERLGAKPVQTPAPEGQTTTLLADGRLSSKSLEIFDPTTLSLALLPSVGLTARAFHSATLLMDGKLLLVGGVAENGKAADNVETWDFKTRTTTALITRLNFARQKHKASLLADGRVLIEAGVDEVGNRIGAVEAYSPESGEFTLAGPIPEINGAPYLVASLPANDATDVPIDTLIALRFSKLLAPRAANAESIVLNGPEGRSYVKVVATENGRMVFVSPLEPLAPNASYTLTIDQAGDGVNRTTCAAIGPVRVQSLHGRIFLNSKQKLASPHSRGRLLRCAASHSRM